MSTGGGPRIAGALFIVPFVLAGCGQAAAPGPGQAEIAGSGTLEGHAQAAGAKALAVDPVTAVSAGLSIASSLKSLFGRDSNQRDLKEIRKKLDTLIAQNNQILQTLGQIVAILNNLGAIIRENVRLENIFEKQALLSGESRQLYDTWLAEIEDRRAARQAAERYRNDILPDVRDTTRQLMDEGYGYSAYDTVGQGMLMEFWMSRRLNERRSLRRNDASAYLAYFNRALDPAIAGAPGKLLADAEGQRDRLTPVLAAADARIGANGWEVLTRRYRWSHTNGRTTTYRDIEVYQKATGNRQSGYALSTREKIVREWRETEPGDGPHCPVCNVLEANSPSPSDKTLVADPPPPAADTPAARVPYWNAVRETLAQAEKDIEVWSKVRDTIEVYRSEAQETASSG